MASARLLRRILGIRQMEEDQSRRLLELAVGELTQLETALSQAKQRESTGRGLVRSSASSGEVLDRIAGLEEARSAASRAAALEPRIRKAEERATSLRQDFLARRTARLQAETLADAEAAREAAASERKGQQALDDWYLNSRKFGKDSN